MCRTQIRSHTHAVSSQTEALILEEIASTLREARERSRSGSGGKLTQQAVADALGIGLRTYIVWEQSGKVPEPRRQALADLLGLEVESLDPSAVRTVVTTGPTGQVDVLSIHPSFVEGLTDDEVAELTHQAVADLYAKRSALLRARDK